MTAEIHTLKTSHNVDAKPKATEFGSVIDQVYSTLDEQLRQLFESMIKSATGKLIILEDQTQDHENPDAYEKVVLERESIRYLLNDTNNISSKFFTNINQQLKPVDSNSDTPQVEELSLVSHEELEEMVAITTMNTNALNDFGEKVSHLNARVEYLEVKNAPIFSSNAVSPKGICEAYQKTLSQLNITTSVNLTLLKLFDEEVNQKTESMYDSLNQIFIDADIMPEIVHTSQEYEAPEEESAFSTETVEYCNTQESEKANFIPHSQAELNNIISQFTKGDISLPGDALELPASFYKDPTQQNVNGEQYYQRKDVVQSLNRLQKKLMEQGKNTGLNVAEEIKRSLIDDIGEANTDGIAKEVTVLDERSIDLVGMLFNAISTDNSVSDVVTELLSQLQIPVIKVALNDEKLFENNAHPTRKVLNLIPEAGKGVTNTKDRLYNKIENVVNDIIAEHDVDVASFYKAVDALHQIIHSEEETAANNEREEQRAVIKEHARTVVVAELRQHSSGKIIPKEVQPLILKHWSTLMLNRYIRHGNESELWSQSILLCKLIIDLLQPVKDKSQFELLSNNYYALAEVVYDELYETDQDKLSIDIQIETLSNIFNKMVDKYAHLMKAEDNKPAVIIDYVTAKQMAEYDASVALAKEQGESVVDKVARLPTYVKPGTWFEIFNGEDRPVRRLKMSVILLETAKIVFVDHKGIKGIEKDAGDFADELNTNKSRLIDDHATFDHALGQVISIMAS